MQEIKPSSHDTTRQILDRMIGKRLTSINRRILHISNKNACSFEWLTGLELRFGRHAIHISVDADDDTLIVSRTPHEDQDTILINGSSHPLWKPVSGKRLAFSWTMINSRGYLDGLAFAFETYAPYATIVAAGGQIHEFSNHDRDRRIPEETATPTEQGINQAIDTLVSNLVYIVDKATQRAAYGKSEQQQARIRRPSGASRSSTERLAQTRPSAAPGALRAQAEGYIRDNPSSDMDQITKALGTTSKSAARAVIQELQRTGDVARPKRRTARSNPVR